MASDFIKPQEQKPKYPQAFVLPKPRKPVSLVPVAVALQGQANLIAKSAGLSLLSPQFFVYNKARMEEELTPDNKGGGSQYDSDALSVLGTPIFDTITLAILDPSGAPVKYQDFNGKDITLPTLRLDIALFEIDLPRNIVKTRVTGRNGTVKEYMSDDDYQIKITGSLINPLANIPPEDMIRKLNAIVKSQIEIPVTANILAYFDISTIVIEYAKFVQKSGYRNVFEFELHCLSDEPFEIKSNNA